MEEKLTGTLNVRVYVTQAELPVEGATVVVTRAASGGKYELLSVQATDSSGMIHPVEVPAPPVEESTEPGGALNGKPFAECSVWAEHPGYTMLEVNGVQVFRGVETFQSMEMTPIAREESGPDSRKQSETAQQEM